MSKIIFHIDVNSAFLSWSAVEKLKNGSDVDIREIPSIIGGDEASRHGIVLAKSVSAKKYGVTTGEPVAAALRKCANLVMEPPNHQMYREYSRQLMDYFKTYTPDIEQLSVDECFLDYTPIAHLYGEPADFANRLKNEVKEKFGYLTTVEIQIRENLNLEEFNEFDDMKKDHEFNLEYKDNKLTITFNKNTISSVDIIGRVMKKLSVIDFIIKETSIEDIVKKMYRNEV